tara:strand:- start:771 stop:1049 length:279 start_codon:yes stop_codon:yes gene_type:complete
MKPTANYIRALQLDAYETILRLERMRDTDASWRFAARLQRAKGNAEKLKVLNEDLHEYHLQAGEECWVPNYKTVGGKQVVEIVRINGQQHGS